MKQILIFSLLLLFQGVLSSQESVEVAGAYYCPPCNSECDNLSFDEPGRCDHCGMRLLFQTPEQHQNMLNVRNMTIGFYLQNGVEVLDFAGPMEVFSYAGFKVVTIAQSKDPIISQGILKVIPDYTIDTSPDLQILATFGGNSRNAFQSEKLVNWVKSQEVDYHFSVCTGAFLFAKAGILDGLKATTFHSAIDDLTEQFPDVEVLSDVRYVDNGTVITTAGISAGIDGALHLVQKLLGLDAANAIAENMEYDKWVPNEGLVIESN